MSVFRTRDVTCPSCNCDVSFDIVYSVNADRRGDLRDAILDGSFQNMPCPRCGVAFRLSPEFTYIDQGRRLWVAAYGGADLGRWVAAEREAQETYDAAFGSGASEAARGIGDKLTRRVTFGWPAVREKLLLREKELDDVVIELMKTAIVRDGGGGVPMNGDVELRVLDMKDEVFVCAWLRVSTEQVFELMEVPRIVYDGIADDLGPWEELRQELTAGTFVDMNRLLIPGEPAVPAAA